MLPHSSFATGCLLLVVMTIFGSTFGNPTNDTSTTKLLLSSFAQSKVLSMRVLDQNLLIITKDSMVYKVPMANYANSQYGVVPVELTDKWPMLTSNDNFTKQVLNGGKAQSFSIGVDKETLVLAFSNQDGLLKTVTFSFKPPNATYQEIEIYGQESSTKYAHLISSDVSKVFWKFDLCKKSDGNGSDVIVFETPFSNCAHVDWKIENGGFVYLNRFHLFTKDQVYIFGHPGAGNFSQVALKVVKLTDFFTRIIPIPTNGTVFDTNKNDASISIIFVIVAMSLLIVVLVCAIVMKMIFYKKSVDDDVQNRDDKNSVNGELHHIQQLPIPKESLNDSAAVAGPSNLPHASTFGKVSSKSAKSVAIISSKL